MKENSFIFSINNHYQMWKTTKKARSNKLPHFETVESFDLFNAAANRAVCYSSVRSISRSRMSGLVNRNLPINKSKFEHLRREISTPGAVCVTKKAPYITPRAHLHTPANAVFCHRADGIFWPD
jgi:hypothetical protein